MADVPMVSPDELSSYFAWAKVADLPAGKKRFQAIRGLLRDYLKDAGAPATAKNFLSEKMILSAGTRKAPIPAELVKALGPEGVKKFSEQLTIARSYLTGTLPKADVVPSFNKGLQLLEQLGLPEEHIATLRKMGPQRVLKQAGGLGNTVKALTEAQKEPAVLRLAKWAGRKATGSAAPELAAAIPEDIQKAVQLFKPTGGTFSELGKAGVKGTGMLTRGLRAVGPLAAAGAAYDIYSFASTMKEKGQEEQRAQQMAATGEIPAELGGPVMIGQGKDAITASQFLQMVQQRQDALKLARAHVATKEGDLTRNVLSYLSGSDQGEQRAVSRMQLGSARPNAGQQPPVDRVMKNFDEFLRQATSGEGLPGGE